MCIGLRDAQGCAQSFNAISWQKDEKMVQAAIQKVGGGVALAQTPPVFQRFVRFGLADLSRHGAWLVPRLVKSLNRFYWDAKEGAIHDKSEQQIAGWLRSLVDSREHLFLCSENAVGCAEMWRVGGIADPISVRERFVLARSDKHIAEAALFYDECVRWARSLGAEVVFVEEETDVPHDTIKDRIGRLYTRQQTFVRLS